MKEGLEAALGMIRTVYGDMAEPVCVTDEKLNMVWVNRAGLDGYPVLQKQQFFKITLGFFDYQNIYRKLEAGETLILPLSIDRLKRHQLFFTPLVSQEGLFSGCLVQFFPGVQESYEQIAEAEDTQLAVSKLEYNYRSPFAVILSGLKALQTKTKGMEKETLQYFQAVYRNLYILYGHNYTVAESARLKYSEQSLQTKQTDLNRFLSYLCEVVSELGLKDSIKIVYHGTQPLITMFDPERMTTAVLCILSNAIASCKRKHAHHPENIRIEVTLKAEKQDAVIIFTDNGEGIAPSRIEHVADPYFSYIPHTSADSRLGLGLYLTKQIICKHWGKLSVSSEEGQSSTVTVQLPVTRDDRPLFISANPKEYLTNHSTTFYAMLSDVLDIDYL